MHWRALTWKPAPRRGRLLFHLHSGPASRAAGTLSAALHAACSSLPSSNLASQLPRLILQDLLPFSVLFPISRLLLLSTQPTRLSLPLLARAALDTEHNQGRSGRALRDQTELPSATCMHIRWQTESTETERAVEEVVVTSWRSYRWGLKETRQNWKKPHKTFQHRQLQTSCWAHLLYKSRDPPKKVPVVRHLPSRYSMICLYSSCWKNRGWAAQQSHNAEENGHHSACSKEKLLASSLGVGNGVGQGTHLMQTV